LTGTHQSVSRAISARAVRRLRNNDTLRPKQPAVDDVGTVQLAKAPEDVGRAVRHEDQRLAVARRFEKRELKGRSVERDRAGSRAEVQACNGKERRTT
jgi:hypothetical protein